MMDSSPSSIQYHDASARPARSLSELFDVAVYSSSGETDDSSVDQLSALAQLEIPDGYHRWVEKRQREFRAGRHHARVSLSKAGAEHPIVRRGDDGLPLFPRGYHGSITHTGRNTTFAAAVICQSDFRIGLDAENHKQLSEAMVDAILLPHEQRRFNDKNVQEGGSPSDLGTFGLWVFSMKEAFYKCVYPQCAAPFGFLDLDVDVNTLTQEFQVELLTAKYPDVPKQLKGKYKIDEKRIVCGVTWKLT